MAFKDIVLICLTCTAQLCSAGFCRQAYTCYGLCYTTQSSSSACDTWYNWFGWWRCSKYRRVSNSCFKTCYKDECCPGYAGDNCDTPLCFGSTICPNGGTCQSPDNCRCRTGFESRTCSDVDECVAGSSLCDHNCSNTIGSYQCSCHAGYTLAYNGKQCEDVDECVAGLSLCEYNCINTEGSYHCSCHDGYTLADNGKDCEDVDERMVGSSLCDHECINTAGSYQCSCHDGYILAVNGKDCEDVDECVNGSSSCDHHCMNTAGSYQCFCNGGYKLAVDGKHCEDIDECKGSDSGCSHKCMNSIGSFTCACPVGFTLASDIKTCYGKKADPQSPHEGRKLEQQDYGKDEFIYIAAGVSALFCTITVVVIICVIRWRRQQRSKPDILKTTERY